MPSLAIHGGVAPLRGVSRRWVYKTQPHWLFNNPAIGGVTAETPRVKPHP